jgi:sulfoquinovose isomerase
MVSAPRLTTRSATDHSREASPLQAAAPPDTRTTIGLLRSITVTAPLDRPLHRAFLTEQTLDLLNFGRKTATEGVGALWLDDAGEPDRTRPLLTWITSRMTHVYAIGTLLGVPGSSTIANAALRGLLGPLRDTEHGGWFAAAGDGAAADTAKACYDHAFVLLAASSARAAGLADADDLFEAAAATFLDRFWDDATGLCVDEWDRTFTTLSPYRGINANMHAVEAMLAAADITGDPAWSERALRICRFVATTAEQHHWRLPEHFDQTWTPQLEFNRDRPNDPFKPYGATIGHGLEWARLLLHAEATTGTADSTLLNAAVGLFGRAVTDGWAPNGHPGFVYTTGWDGAPVARDRLHWVVAEGINAAAALQQRTGEAGYGTLYDTFWEYAATFLIDHARGSWRHQLDDENHPSNTVWSGKPDTYHVFQAVLGPRLPLTPMITAAIADGHLR